MMNNSTKGLQAFLARPAVYNLFQNLLGGQAARRLFVSRFIRPRTNDRILDVGCGPGELLAFLPHTVDYEGFDLSSEYIETARKCYGNRGKFYCQQVAQENLENREPYDIIIATGLIHHIPDPEAIHLFRTASTALKQGGRLITLDCCFTQDQSLLARKIIQQDRGQFIRKSEEYVELAKQVFPHVQCEILHNMLRIPYTHLIMECSITSP